jgi:hypothetical protein
MFIYTKRTAASLFAIAIASSLVAAGGISLAGYAFAAKKGTDNAVVTNTIKDPKSTDSSSPKSKSNNAGDSSSVTGSDNRISGKDLKSLSKCEADAAKDGGLTLAEVHDCYSEAFNHAGQGQGTDQSSPSTGNDQLQGGRGPQKSSLLNGLNGAMREGFPF